MGFWLVKGFRLVEGVGVYLRGLGGLGLFKGFRLGLVKVLKGFRESCFVFLESFLDVSCHY